MAGNRITLSELEREHILSTLRGCRGNRTHAACSPRHFRSRLTL